MAHKWLLLGVSAIWLGACTTVPTPSAEFAKNGAVLSAADGVRAKRLAAPAPTPPIEAGARLRIEDVRLAADIVANPQVNAQYQGLLTNALARNLCRDFSQLFDIAADPKLENTYRLRAVVSQLTTTSRVGATIGAVSGRLAPVGVRPPFGLGAITIEFELFRPDDTLATAMVWSQSADVASARASVSTIGDAYNFIGPASSDFANLAQGRAPSIQALERVRDLVGNGPDEACKVYGDAPNFLTRFVPLSPSVTDGGRRPPP